MPFLLPEIRCWQEIWPEFTCLRVRVSENHFGNPETSKLQTNNRKARTDTCGIHVVWAESALCCRMGKQIVPVPMAKGAPTQVVLKQKSILEAQALNASDEQGAAVPLELHL